MPSRSWYDYLFSPPSIFSILERRADSTKTRGTQKLLNPRLHYPYHLTNIYTSRVIVAFGSTTL